jgi:hypothetical protein
MGTATGVDIVLGGFVYRASWRGRRGINTRLGVTYAQLSRGKLRGKSGTRDIEDANTAESLRAKTESACCRLV